MRFTRQRGKNNSNHPMVVAPSGGLQNFVHSYPVPRPSNPTRARGRELGHIMFFVQPLARSAFTSGTTLPGRPDWISARRKPRFATRTTVACVAGLFRE